MRPSIPKLIAAASIFAAIPLSSAYAVHRHHRTPVDTMTTASVPADPQARAATQQLLGVKQGIRTAREMGKISEGQARELMQQDKLRELAVVLTETIRQNTTIDWTIKESVKAKLKVAVKRILRKYGYPPDMQVLATETVLKQAEMIASELTNK